MFYVWQLLARMIASLIENQKALLHHAKSAWFAMTRSVKQSYTDLMLLMAPLHPLSVPTQKSQRFNVKGSEEELA